MYLPHHYAGASCLEAASYAGRYEKPVNRPVIAALGIPARSAAAFDRQSWMQVDWGSYPNAFPRREPTENSLSALALRSAKSNTCCDKIFNCVSTRGQMQLPAASNT